MNTRAVSDWDIEIQRSRTVLLNSLLLTAMIGGLVALVLTYISLPEGLSVPEQLVEIAPFVAGWLIVLIPWAWRDLGYRTRAAITLLLTYSLSLFIFYRGGLSGSGRVWMLLCPVLTFLLLGPRPGIWAGIASVLTYTFFAVVMSQGWLVPLLAETGDPNALQLWIGEGASFLLIVAIFTLMLWSYNRSWLEALTGAVMANRQLQAQTRELEETTEQLRRQTSQLQTTAEIAHVGSSILDPERLFTEAVSRIQEGFSLLGVYYVGLFLLDEQFAVLRAATGEAGRLLLEMNYQLELAETSAIGWCIIHRQPHIALDIAENTVQLDALSMPNTRSEIALPLRSRGRILGALSVHSTREAVFDESDVALLQTMADQVALAIDNARLFSQTEAALEEVQAAHQRYLGREWREFLDTKPVARIDYSRPGHSPVGASVSWGIVPPGPTPLRGGPRHRTDAPAGMEVQDDGSLHEARRQAMASGQTVVVDGLATDDNGETAPPQTALVVPLKLREQVIGTIALHEMRHQRPWAEEEIALAETVAEQTALTVETLRLMDEMQRRAARERLISEISGRVRASLDPDTILKTTVRELGRVLGAESASIEMTVSTRHSPIGATATMGHRPGASAEPPFGGDGEADAAMGDDGETIGEEPVHEGIDPYRTVLLRGEE